MSDGAAPLVESGGESSAPAAPQSTQSIAADVISSAEKADAGDAGGYVESPRVDTTNTAEVAPPVELSETQKFLEAMGHKPKKVDGRDNWLPYRSIETMLEKYAEQRSEALKAEREKVASEAKQYQTYVEQLREAVKGDPKAFLGELAQVDPRYKAFLEQQAAAPVVQQPVAQMPGPDLRLPDGSMTYSLEGLQKLLEWNTQQVQAKLMPEIDNRLKPIAEREAQAKKDAAFNTFQQQQREATQKKMQDATKWAGFGDFAADGSLNETQAAILAELQKDQTLSLEAAYLKVVGPKLATRETLAKQLHDAPKAPALSRQSADATTKAPGKLTTADIARQVAAKLENA